MDVPFVNLGLQYIFLRNQILEKFDEISKKGEYILGSELEKFEHEFANYCGTKFAIGVGNGSDALSLSMIALGIKKDDEVIIPGNSFIATASTVVNVGATPVFVDVLDDYNIDPQMIQKAITKKTKAIIPVHLTGRMADLGQIMQIANENNIYVIEDAAQSVGASLNNKKSGSFGIIGCFSLHPLKNLHVQGDGGIITTNDEKIFNFIKKIRNHGLQNRNESEFWGYNSRLDNIQAAIGRIKLPYIDKWNKRFIAIANIYSKELSQFAIVPKEDSNKISIYHRYIIQHSSRDRLKDYLNKNSIETKINYPVPLHLQPAAKELGYKKGDLPKVETQSKLILSLPIYAEITDQQIDRVIYTIKSFKQNS